MTTYLVVTEAFRSLALAQMKVRRAEVPLIVIPHPLGGLKPSEVEERVRAAVDALLRVDAVDE
jgi:hypothetical protein